MESLQSTKTRLKAVKNVGQITKAMEVVAATKMRRAQETALNSRPYAFEALGLLGRILESAPLQIPLSEKREVKKTLLVVIASDRGLAGAFNGQVFRLADQFFAYDIGRQAENHTYGLIAVGKKAAAWAVKKPYPLIQSYENAADLADIGDIGYLADTAAEGFLKGEWDRVITISTHFRTALKQEPLARQILPLEVEKVRQTLREIVPEHGRYSGLARESGYGKTGEPTEYIFEPSPREALEALVPHLVEMQLYHLFLEAKASEHSARRVAMKTASDNAAELSDELQLAYNKARQVGITRELSEITTTIMTLE